MSFGHVGFMGLGAYVSALVTMPIALKRVFLPELPPFLAHAQLGFVPSLLLAMIVVGMIAAVLGVPIMRLPANALSVGTFAVLVIVFIFLSTAESLTRGGQAVFGIPKNVDLGVAVACAISFTVAARVFRESPWGLALQATRDDEVAATAHGIGVVSTRMKAWMSSAVLMGAAGGVWAHYLTGFSPRSFYFDETFLLMAMMITGGMGSVLGAVLGAVLISAGDQLLLNVENGSFLWWLHYSPISGFSTVVLSIAILMMLRFRREGLAGTSRNPRRETSG
jgi:branched-chain amino acid transport system permease protein